MSPSPHITVECIQMPELRRDSAQMTDQDRTQNHKSSHPSGSDTKSTTHQACQITSELQISIVTEETCNSNELNNTSLSHESRFPWEDEVESVVFTCESDESKNTLLNDNANNTKNESCTCKGAETEIKKTKNLLYLL